MSKGKMKVVSAVDACNKSAPPLNFAFRSLLRLCDIERENPRHEQAKLKKSPKSGKYKTKSIRLNNNFISDYDDFEAAIDGVLENPSELEWIDLSFNDISTVDQVLLNYPSLKMIYLHGNHIDNVAEIDKLAGLPNLKSLSCHGNPIEQIKGYKNYILSHLPQIQNLDFTTITKADRELSNNWNKKFGVQLRKKSRAWTA